MNLEENVPVRTGKFRLLAVILIAVFSLAVGGVGGYLVGSTRQQSLPTALQASPSPSWLPSASPVPRLSLTPTLATSKTDQTANWKTYRDPQGFFSIKYPSDWQLRFLPRQPRGEPVLPEFVKFFSPYSPYRIYLTTHDNNSHFPLSQWTERYVVDMAMYRENVKRRVISINGRQVEAISGAHLPAESDSLHLYVDMKEVVLEFSLWPYISEQFQTEIDKEAQAVLYLMVASAELLP